MDKVNKGLHHIMKKRFGMELSKNWEDMQDELLLGSKFGLQASDLLYLFFDIEKEFGITISDEDVANGSFSSLRNIARVIRRELHTDQTLLQGTQAS